MLEKLVVMNDTYLSFLKIPLTVLVFGLVIILLDLYGISIESIGVDGIKVKKQAALTQKSLEVIEEQNQRINQLSNQVNRLLVGINEGSLGDSNALVYDDQELSSDSVESAQIVSLAVQQYSALRNEVFEIEDDESGYIWIGNSTKGEGVLERSQLIDIASGATVTSLEQVEEQLVFKVAGNNVVRATKFNDDSEYFRASEIATVLSRSTKIRIVGKPIPYRAYTGKAQYWVKIEKLKD